MKSKIKKLLKNVLKTQANRSSGKLEKLKEIKVNLSEGQKFFDL